MRHSTFHGLETLTRTSTIDTPEEFLVPESSFCLLKRYLVVSDYAGSFQTPTVSLKDGVCRTVYTVSPFIPLWIHKRRLMVKCIVRVFLDQSTTSPFSIAFFLKSGRLIRQRWHQGCPYFYEVDPEGSAAVGQTELETANSSLKDEVNYLKLHPELNFLLKELVKFVKRKPAEDPIQTSIDYFRGLGDENYRN
jgi:hypothetical protein